MAEFVLPNGQHLIGVHLEGTCRGEWCAIHKPLDTYDRKRLFWRDDRAMFEVICEHSVGHPAPEQFEFWERMGLEAMATHGCDGCCAEWTPHG